ncbi:MAG: nascent polypeptide-associated complex protein [Candidatus Marsarchaeota archaeon]|jgi:nascent polypeptide-associated complex subunit alpha|nr:nascent polypeptide-associated complex protein [Candidatus Marsarchaeota archaeon]MCL5115127.1 nascent polypeptide-associated complex protein [Candidatus Marsarchaeota archaeon]
MMPNIDPRALKGMMAKMGIKSTDLIATKVTIECQDKDIVIEAPQVTRIEMQGAVSFQIAGTITEKEKPLDIDITDDDIDTVKQATGISDTDVIKEALKASGGDIAKAILSLKPETS